MADLLDQVHAATQGDLLDQVHAQTSGKTPGALSRFGSGVYETTVQPAVETVSHPIDALVGLGKRLIGKDDLDAIAGAVKSGDYSGAALHLGKWALSRTPEGMALEAGYHQLEPAIENVKKGNYLGAAGNVLGTGLSVGAAALPVKGRGPLTDAERLTKGAVLPEVAAKNASEALMGGVKETPWGDLSGVQKAATEGDQGAKHVLNLISNTEDVPSRVQQASIALQDWKTAQTAEDLYRKVDRIADQHAQQTNSFVPATGTEKALDFAIRRANFGVKERGVNSILQD